MTGRALLLDTNPDRILVAIHAHLDHTLGLTGTFALAPQRIAGAAEIPGLAARNRLAQRLFVHMRDHHHVAGRGIGGDAGDEPRGVEFRVEREPLLALLAVCGT